MFEKMDFEFEEPNNIDEDEISNNNNNNISFF